MGDKSIPKAHQEELKIGCNRDLFQINIKIDRLNEGITTIAENSLSLQRENISIYQDRLQNGQFAASENNIQEKELQNLSERNSELTIFKWTQR